MKKYYVAISTDGYILSAAQKGEEYLSVGHFLMSPESKEVWADNRLKSIRITEDSYWGLINPLTGRIFNGIKVSEITEMPETQEESNRVSVDNINGVPAVEASNFEIKDEVKVVSQSEENDEQVQYLLKEDDLKYPQRTNIVHPVGFRFGAYILQWDVKDPNTGFFYTKNTNFCLDYYTQYPLLYAHGNHNALGLTRIGVIDAVVRDDIGLRAEGVLFYQSQWFPAFLVEIQKKAMILSTAPAAHLQKINSDTGEILQYPIIEFSFILNKQPEDNSDKKEKENNE